MIRKILLSALILAFALSFMPIESAEALDYYNAYPEYVYYWDGSDYRNQTGAAQTPDLGDIFLGRDAAPKNSALYITMGHFEWNNTAFNEMNINVTQVGINGEILWEYYADPGGWLPLDVIDETNGFTEPGWGKVTWDIPSDWIGNSINGKSGLWVRARTTDSFGQPPYGGQIEVMAYNLRVKVLDNAGQGFEGLDQHNFIMSDLTDDNVYGIREIGGGVYELAVSTAGIDTDGMLDVSIAGWASSGAIATGILSNRLVDLTDMPFEMTPGHGVSAAYSMVTATPGSVIANGTATAMITVSARDPEDNPLEGVNVTLITGHDAIITPGEAATNQSGEAYFEVSSETEGTATFSAAAGGVEILQTAQINFVSSEVASGALIKLFDDGDPATQHDSAVYYLAENSKRYTFPNSRVYSTWYDDFSQVVEVSDEDMASLSLGGNVTYRPGVRMLKIQSDPKTYAVALDATLRWVETEEIAIGLYGPDWNTKIDDVDVTNWVDYAIGTPITDISQYNPSAMIEDVQTINENLGFYD